MLGAVWNNSISFHQQNCLEHHLHFHDGRKHKICQVFFLCQRIKHDEHTEHGELGTEMDIYSWRFTYVCSTFIYRWMDALCTRSSSLCRYLLYMYVYMPARIRAANYGRYFYLTVSKLSCWLPLFKCS